MNQWGDLEHYFGINSEQLYGQTVVSSEAPVPSDVAGPGPGGRPGTVSAFTDWRHSPVFWLAVFAILALGAVHLEGSIGARLGA